VTDVLFPEMPPDLQVSGSSATREAELDVPSMLEATADAVTVATDRLNGRPKKPSCWLRMMTSTLPGCPAKSAPLNEGANRIGDPLAGLAPPPISLFPDGRCGVGGLLTQPTGAASKGCSGGDWAGTTCEPGILCVRVSPGRYWGGWRIDNNMKIQMEPGVYYMAGGGITLQAGGSIESVGGIGGTPPAIMVFNSDNPNYACPGGPAHQCQGSIDFLANSTFSVRGLTEAACAPLGYPKCPYAGLLIWQDGSGSDPDAVVKLGGQTNLNVSGTIYAPKAEVVLTGGSAGTGVASVQIISWRWDIGGGANLYMPYDPAGLYHVQRRGLVH